MSEKIVTMKDCAGCDAVSMCDAHVTGGPWKHRGGPNPCRFVRDEIIDADDALKDTPFADVEPFDPEKFVSDVIGS
jgi:hypothetical protein